MKADLVRRQAAADAALRNSRAVHEPLDRQYGWPECRKCGGHEWWRYSTGQDWFCSQCVAPPKLEVE